MDKSSDNKGKYTLIASILSSVLIVILFAGLAVMVNRTRVVPLYSQVDIIAGMVFVFVLTMIVSASIWPEIIEKRLR
ncbi:MAG TPA: hypothetical protein PKC27_02925 [Methanomethylovorans sp.]|uniref:hypothetical protein n=1 Tax=Methanomethylovorans sp. TaxID=2758717 RepID=UPI002C0BA4FC|nr:hypothetical protein [Methanomethylovorans sp.]